MKAKQAESLTKDEVLKVLYRHYGSFTKIADRLGIRQAGVSAWAVGRATSARVEAAAGAMAMELLEQERLAERVA
jgi:DNA-binding transcriptional regulator YdaS (Cro superfamily)